MKILSKKVAPVLIVAMTISMGCSKNEQSSAQMWATVQTDIERENAAAIAARPDLLPAQAIAQSASKRAGEMLANASDANDKVFLAASQFIGFYNANIKSRYEICSSVGVDITPFVNAYKSAHVNEYRIASDAIAKQNVNIDQASASEVNGRPLVRQSMENMARKYNLTLSELCDGFALDPGYFASEFSSRNKQPETYAALHGQ